MKKTILLFIATLLLWNITAYSQQEKLEIEGAIKIANFEDPTPDPGTIRWTGSDFEGWNGIIWVSLTGNASVGSVIDIDGNPYQTIRIGNQTWMTENLRTTHYNDGTAIQKEEVDVQWLYRVLLYRYDLGVRLSCIEHGTRQ